MSTFQQQRLTRVNAATCPITALETAGQSFKRGQLVVIDASGYVHAVADAGVGVIGIALADASGVTAAQVLVDVIRPGDLLEVTVYHATKASAVLTNANVGLSFRVITVSNITMLDISSSSTPLFHIVARSLNNSATDVYPRAIVTVISTALQSVDCTQI